MRVCRSVTLGYPELLPCGRLLCFELIRADTESGQRDFSVVGALGPAHVAVGIQEEVGGAGQAGLGDFFRAGGDGAGGIGEQDEVVGAVGVPGGTGSPGYEELVAIYMAASTLEASSLSLVSQRVSPTLLLVTRATATSCDCLSSVAVKVSQNPSSVGTLAPSDVP